MENGKPTGVTQQVPVPHAAGNYTTGNGSSLPMEWRMEIHTSVAASCGSGPLLLL